MEISSLVFIVGKAHSVGMMYNIGSWVSGVIYTICIFKMIKLRGLGVYCFLIFFVSWLIKGCIVLSSEVVLVCCLLFIFRLLYQLLKGLVNSVLNQKGYLVVVGFVGVLGIVYEIVSIFLFISFFFRCCYYVILIVVIYLKEMSG